ncbi:MAG: asparaginase domain-containing protein [Rickettsiales bacterium]
MDHEKILLVTTGGTIEAMYNPEEGTPFYVPVPKSAHDTCIPAALHKMGFTANVDTYPLAMKDSKEVTTEMLDHILWKAATEGYQRIVIVHGTDTMPVHARYLKRRIAEYGAEYGMDEKSFVFTGAMGPLRDKRGEWRDPEAHPEYNDGWVNLGLALRDTGAVAPGVYVEMGNGAKEADTIGKHVEVDLPGNHAAKVVHSGFVADDPTRHITEIF